jgi:hypothetical protein
MMPDSCTPEALLREVERARDHYKEKYEETIQNINQVQLEWSETRKELGVCEAQLAKALDIISKCNASCDIPRMIPEGCYGAGCLEKVRGVLEGDD